jgi:putative endonuclease
MGSGLAATSSVSSVSPASDASTSRPAIRPAIRHVARQRHAAERRGRAAETAVAAHWQSCGFELLAHRLRTKAGEIDLVLADPTTLVFVEVKSRRSLAEASYAVSPRQQGRLYQAADAALSAHETWRRPNTRFDVALVCDGAIEHIQDAIRPY